MYSGQRYQLQDGLISCSFPISTVCCLVLSNPIRHRQASCHIHHKDFQVDKSSATLSWAQSTGAWPHKATLRGYTSIPFPAIMYIFTMSQDTNNTASAYLGISKCRWRSVLLHSPLRGVARDSSPSITTQTQPT